MRLVFETLTLETETGDLFRDGIRNTTLSRKPALMLGAFMRAHEGFLTREAAYDALYWNVGESKEPTFEVITVWASRLRTVLQPLGYTLASNSGRGYRLQRSD